MLHIFIPASSSTYTSSTSTSFTRYFFDLLFGELFPPSVSAEGACAWLEGGGVAGARPLGQLQAAVELVGAVMAKLGRLLAGSSLSYLLGVLCWIGATLQAMLDTSEATGPLRGLRNTLYSTLATFYSKFEGFEVGEVEGRAVCRVFLWRALPTFHTEFIHSSSGLLTLLLAWSRSKVLRRLLLLTHPDTGHNLLHTVCKVLNKTGASTKVIDSVLDIVHNLVREEEEEEGEEQAGALATSEGMAMVVAEMAPILAHFRSWIEATNANLKRLARVGVKLDILAMHLKECEHNPKKPVACVLGCGLTVPKDEMVGFHHNLLHIPPVVLHHQPITTTSTTIISPPQYTTTTNPSPQPPPPSYHHRHLLPTGGAQLCAGAASRDEGAGGVAHQGPPGHTGYEVGHHAPCTNCALFTMHHAPSWSTHQNKSKNYLEPRF